MKRIQKRLFVSITVFALGVSSLSVGSVPSVVNATSGKTTTGQTTARALLVARGDYADDDSELSPGPENDADGLEGALYAAYGDNVTINKVTERTKNNSKAKVSSLIQSTFEDSDDDDINYFMYSGHGTISNNKPYLYLEDGQLMDAADLLECFDGIRGKNVLLIDSCFSGGMIDKSNLNTEQSEQITDEAQTFSDSFLQEFKQADQEQDNSLAASQKGMIASSNLAQSNFHVLVACASSEVSYIEEVTSQDIYSYMLFSVAMGCGYDEYKQARLSEAPADANRDGNISMKEMYDYVRIQDEGAQNIRAYPEADTETIFPSTTGKEPAMTIEDVKVTYDSNLNATIKLTVNALAGGTMYYDVAEDTKTQCMLGSLGAWMATDSSYAVSRHSYTLQQGVNKITLDAADLNMSNGSMYYLIMQYNESEYIYTRRIPIRSTRASLPTSFTMTGEDTFTVDGSSEYQVATDIGTQSYNMVGYILRIRSSVLNIPYIKAEVVNESGEVVRTLCAGEFANTLFTTTDGEKFKILIGRNVYWDGKTDDGTYITESGIYTVRVIYDFGGVTTGDVITQTKNVSVTVNGSVPSATPYPSKTPYPSASASPSVSPTATASGSPSPTPTASQTPIPSVSGVPIVSTTPLITAQPIATATPVITPTETVTPELETASVGKVKLSGKNVRTRKVILQWKKVANASGYEIYVSKKKSGKYKRCVTVGSTKKKYCKKNLSIGKNYYFKTRAYSKQQSKKVYGKWSKIVHIRIKK